MTTHCCKDCRHFTDAKFSRVYVTPICLAHGGDDAMFMRRYICGLDEAKLFQPITSGSVHAHVCGLDGSRGNQ